MSGSAKGGLRWLLRAEGAALLAGAMLAYDLAGNGWLLFALLFLVPDLSMLGYLAGPRPGAALYNAAHATPGPIALAAAGLLAAPALLPFALIWLAHIGFDRMLGYGLKYAADFHETHLGRIGRS
jgi:hypothetical protein